MAVLGVHSFCDPHYRTGIQHMAGGFAERGALVDYVAAPSSPFDLVGRARRRRLRRVWGSMGLRPVAAPQPGLREYSFPAVIPVHGLFVRGRAMLGLVEATVPRWFRNKPYDVLIHDVGPGMVYASLVRARLRVLRLNDFPRGFGDMPTSLVQALERRMADGFYGQIWAVSPPLASLARRMAPGTPVHLVPNGVDAGVFKACPGRRGRTLRRKAVYLGGEVPWLDIDLVMKTARLLPEWEFHFVGGGYEDRRNQGNVKFLGPVAHAEIAEILKQYDVGLLPYKDVAGRMAYVHRPLKFFEYYAAGLGVACAAVGGLGEGLAGMARFGSGARDFARAVAESGAASEAVSECERREFLAANSWEARIDAVCGLVGGLV